MSIVIKQHSCHTRLERAATCKRMILQFTVVNVSRCTLGVVLVLHTHMSAPRPLFKSDWQAAHVSTPAPSSTPAPPARTTNGAANEGPRRSSENSRADRNGAEEAGNRSGDLGRGSAAENGAVPPSPERSAPRRQSPPRGRLSDEEVGLLWPNGHKEILLRPGLACPSEGVEHYTTQCIAFPRKLSVT
jgi:hypothetical protein